MGLQVLDEQFRAAHGHLRLSVDLRENYALALLHFRESCGRGPQALLRDCIELVVIRAKASELSLSLDVIGDVSGCGLGCGFNVVVRRGEGRMAYSYLPSENEDPIC